MKKRGNKSSIEQPSRWGFSKKDYRILVSLRTPQKIQDFLDKKIMYNNEENGETCKSPAVVLKNRKAHCIEGAILAAAALRIHGEKPLIVDLAATRDHDHVVCVFKRQGCWGAISMSKYHSLQYRDPVFKTLRELALSYFPFYNNKQGSKTLVSYSVPVNLKRFDNLKWMTLERDMWEIGNHLFTVKHMRIVTPEQRKILRPLSRAFMKADQITSSPSVKKQTKQTVRKKKK